MSISSVARSVTGSSGRSKRMLRSPVMTMTGTPAASGTRRRRPRSPLQNHVDRPLKNGNGRPGDEMLESDRLEWGRDLRQPDGRGRDHGHAAMILVEDVSKTKTFPNFCVAAFLPSDKA